MSIGVVCVTTSHFSRFIFIVYRASAQYLDSTFAQVNRSWYFSGLKDETKWFVNLKQIDKNTKFHIADIIIKSYILLYKQCLNPSLDRSILYSASPYLRFVYPEGIIIEHL